MLTRLLIVRPSVRVHAKKDDFVAPADAPGEGGGGFQSGMSWDHVKTHLKRNP